MSERESFDYYLRFAEVTEQLVETLGDTIPDIPSNNQSLDEEMQKALWVTRSLIRRWREAAHATSVKAVSVDDHAIEGADLAKETQTRFARK
ncbi:MAG: hypothetical protein AAF292_08130 [Pseudomonadota bacterium]